MIKLQQIFPYALIAFIVGVGASALANAAWWVCALTLLLAVFFAFFWFVFRRSGYIIAVIMFAMISLGAFRYELWFDGIHEGALDEYVGKRVTITALVVDEPDERESNTHLTVHPEEIDGRAVAPNDPARLLLFLSRYPEYHYGDMVVVEGVIRAPEPFGDELGREFDYPMYLSSKGIHGIMFFASTSLREREKGNALVASLFKTKTYFLEHLSALYPEPQSSLLSGLILGGKQSLGSEWLDIFKQAGIIHIVVLSGYNMTIVSQWLVVMFRFLGFYGSLTVGTFGIVFFTIMTGAGATVVRAAVMAIIALLARATGRTYTMGRALLLAGVCMVIHNPSILLFDPSFQLSFLASLGLIFVSPVIEVRTGILKRFPALREVLISTLATQVTVLPLLLYQTGMLSLVALPVNFLVLPFIPVTMLFGFIAGVVAIVVPPLAPIVALPAHILLSYILGVSRIGASIPYATVSVPIGPIVLVVLYAALSLMLFRMHKAKNPSAILSTSTKK